MKYFKIRLWHLQRLRLIISAKYFQDKQNQQLYSRDKVSEANLLGTFTAIVSFDSNNSLLIKIKSKAKNAPNMIW